MTDYARTLEQRVNIPSLSHVLPLLATDFVRVLQLWSTIHSLAEAGQEFQPQRSFEQVPRVRDRQIRRQIRALHDDAAGLTPRGAKRKHSEAQELEDQHIGPAPPTPASARRHNAPVRAPVRSFLKSAVDVDVEVEVDIEVEVDVGVEADVEAEAVVGVSRGSCWSGG